MRIVTGMTAGIVFAALVAGGVLLLTLDIRPEPRMVETVIPNERFL